MRLEWYQWKVVYNKQTEMFMTKRGEESRFISDADLYEISYSNEKIISFYDEDSRNDLDVWRIEIAYNKCEDTIEEAKRIQRDTIKLVKKLEEHKKNKMIQ